MNSLYARKLRNGCGGPALAALFVGVVFAFGSAAPSHAQALGWEGETGVFVTPLAYTASSETERFHPRPRVSLPERRPGHRRFP